MSYLVIPVYSFQCDGDNEHCSRHGNPEITPANMGRPDESLLTIAHRLLRKEGWSVRRVEGHWEHLCPDHERARG